MKEENKRRSFLKKLAIGGLGTAVTPTTFLSAKNTKGNSINEKLEQIIKENGKRKFNTEYKGEYLNRVAFPIGGIGAGMFCIEGTGALSHMSVRNKPEIYNEPALFFFFMVKRLQNAPPVYSWAARVSKAGCG